MPPYNFVAGGIIKTKTGSNLLSVSILSLRIIRLNKPSSKSHKTFGQQTCRSRVIGLDMTETISNDLVMEIGWTDVGSGGWFFFTYLPESKI
jgi:hypothetical protein